MGTIAEKLTYLNDTKTAIKNAVVAKGVSVSDADTFRSYADKIGQIESGGGAPATKFGCTIDNFLGSVDADGVYTKPTEPIVLDLSGVKKSGSGFAYRFARSGVAITITAPDLSEVQSGGFDHAFYGAQSYTASFGSIETITSDSAFEAAFGGGIYVSPTYDVVFSKLKTINANYVFRDCFDRTAVDLGVVFPALEEIQGNIIFRNLDAPSTHNLNSVKKIVAGSSKYNACFYISMSGGITINLPNATDVSGYVCYTTSSNTCILHFAAANQAAIEACDGYSYMFGATEIYFDLITTITVDGVVYSRGLTIDGYTAWEDGANVIYTDATAEPAVGTVVYSDQGTTQVGTVSAVV